MSLTHNFKIKVITIDEGIPGYRNEALEIVKKVCCELSVDYKIYSYKDLFELTLDEALDLRSEVYSENQIKKVVEIYQSVLRNILKDCTDENLICVFLEKPRYSVTSNGHKYFKRGFHLHFPYGSPYEVAYEFHMGVRL